LNRSCGNPIFPDRAAPWCNLHRRLTTESGLVAQAGDYTTLNFNHFCDGTSLKGEAFGIGTRDAKRLARDANLMSAPGHGAREADRGSNGEILQPLVTLLGPYALHPPVPLGAAVGLTDLHCEDQEQPDHAYQIANLAHAYAAFGALPRGEREIFTS
jgi:hypothetical protein